MRVELNADRLLSRAEFKRAQRCLSEAFPGGNLQLKVRYPALKPLVEADIRKVTGLLSELVAHESPGSVPFLDWKSSEWKLEGDRLTVCVSSDEGALYLKMRKVDKLIEDLLFDLFAIQASVSVRVTGNEEKRIAEIAEHRRREEELIAAAAAQETKKSGSNRKTPTQAVLGKSISEASIPMSELTEDAGRVTLTGEVSGFEMRDTKNGQTKIVTFSMTDYTGSVNCKLFLSSKRGEDAASVAKQAEALTPALKDGCWVKVRGSYRYDDFKHEMVLMASDIVTAEKPVREDKAPEKRVELHAHTQMSTMDACVSATDLIKQAAAWGHKAIAITDHGVVQAFPEAFGAAKKAGI